MPPHGRRRYPRPPMPGATRARALGWRFVPSGLVFGLVLLGPQRSEAIERAHGLADGIAGDMSIERRGLELGMPKQDLDDANIDVLLEQVGREAVAQGVRRHALADLGHVGCGMAGARGPARLHRADLVLAREQPTLRARNAIPIAQKLQ